jgi:hypothetical protein
MSFIRHRWLELFVIGLVLLYGIELEILYGFSPLQIVSDFHQSVNSLVRD